MFTANARPHITSTQPTDGATNVSTSASIVLNFDTDVYTNDDPDAVLEIRNYDTDELVQSLSIMSLDAPGSQIGIDLTEPLPESTHLYIVAKKAGIIFSELNGES